MPVKEEEKKEGGGGGRRESKSTSTSRSRKIEEDRIRIPSLLSVHFSWDRILRPVCMYVCVCARVLLDEYIENA